MKVLYINLIKSINAHPQNSLMNTIDNDSKSTDETIKNNNQFIIQLNSMMRSANSSQPFASQSLDTLNEFHLNNNSNANEINWFHLLAKICVYKANQILDCLLFSIFKKIAQLTPPLFGSLLGPYANKFHKVILDKLTLESDGQTLTIVSEFLCSIIKYQSGYFHTLALLKKENVSVYTEEEQSIFKALFGLLGKIKTLDKVKKIIFLNKANDFKLSINTVPERNLIFC